jgi:ribokinase
MAPEVMVVGQLARDLVLQVDELPPPGGTVDARSRRELLGGKGANQAVALAQLGVPAGLLGVVGDDEIGDRLLAQARHDGVDVANVTRREQTPTALIVDVVDGHGQWRYLQDIPTGMLLAEADVAPAAGALRRAAAVSVQLQQPSGAALAAVEYARAGGALVVLDGAPADDERREALLAAADVIRADARETEQLAGAPVGDLGTAVRVGNALLDRGPGLVALGTPDGNLFVWAGHHVFLPLVDTPMVDQTGAGDAFTAGLTAALVRGDPPARAAQLAVAAAAATVGHAGGRPNLTADTIRAQLHRVRTTQAADPSTGE